MDQTTASPSFLEKLGDFGLSVLNAEAQKHYAVDYYGSGGKVGAQQYAAKQKTNQAMMIAGAVLAGVLLVVLLIRAAK